MGIKEKPNINFTIAHDLCTGCGLCEGVCPNSAISFPVDNGLFRPKINKTKCKNDKGCHRCYDMCPGLGTNILAIGSELFAKDGAELDRLCGYHLESYCGYSMNTDIRYHSASGGMVTQLLIWLLENHHIDGAVVTKFDKSAPLKVKSFIATTKEDVLSAKSSKYAPVALHDAIKDIKEAKGNRFVVVGLPCHIQGFRKAEKNDSRLRSKIVGHFAIYCSSSRSFNFTKYVMKERGINLDRIDYLAYRDRGNQGGLVAIGTKANGESFDYYQDYRKYSHPLRSIFVPRRCLLCIDHYGELADISFGDINIKPFNEDKVGINSLIVRSVYWNSILQMCFHDGVIHLEKIPVDIVNQSQPSAKMKKTRNRGFVALVKMLGGEIPVYDEQKKTPVSMKCVISYFVNRVQQFVGRKEKLWFLIKYFKKNM